MGEHSRREFLGLTLPAGVALGAGLTALQPSSTFAAPAQLAHTGPGGNGAVTFELELDGKPAGLLDSAYGGDATSSVVLDTMQRKHLAGVKYEDIVLTCGAGMSPDFYQWIKATVDRHPVAKSGAIVASDVTGRALYRLQWTNGLLTEIGFPACDATSMSPVRMTVKITPASSQMIFPATGASRGVLPVKRWASNNFRLTILGCQTACAHVNAIDAIVLKEVVPGAGAPAGALRAVQIGTRLLEIPNLCLSAVEADATEFYKWYEDFLVKGQNAPANEKTGTLEYLAIDNKPIFTLSFSGLGIFKFAPEKVEAGVPTIRRVRAEMYCNSIGFTTA
jgi:hypothetical protein